MAMAGMPDPLTDLPPPSRFDLDELNNFAFDPSPSPSSPPFIAWAPSTPFVNGKLPTRLLLLASSLAGCHLLHHLPNKRLIGSVILPEIPLAHNTLEPSAQDKACYLYSLDERASVVLASIQYSVTPDRTHAWVKLIFEAIEPENVLMLGAIQRDHFRGKLSADDQLVFRLETDRQRLANEVNAATVPYFPSGSLVDGIAAAVLSRCQIQGLRGRLLLSWPDCDASVLSLLVSALSSLLPKFLEAQAMDFSHATKAPFRRKSVSDLEIYF